MVKVYLLGLKDVFQTFKVDFLGLRNDFSPFKVHSLGLGRQLPNRKIVQLHRNKCLFYSEVTFLSLPWINTTDS